jgi:hypothetical protein
MGDCKLSSFCGTSEASPQTCQMISSTQSGPAGYPQHAGHSCRPAWGQLVRCSPLCGPHLQGRTPAGAIERWVPPSHSTTLLQGIEDLSHQVAALGAQ